MMACVLNLNKSESSELTVWKNVADMDKNIEYPGTVLGISVKEWICAFEIFD